MLLPGTPIHPTGKQLERLNTALGELIDHFETKYGPLMEDLRVWWRNYESIPLRSRKDFPFANAPLHPEMEVLTRHGWVYITDVNVGDYALTRRDEDGALEWQPVLARPKVHADGLLRFRSNSVDQIVTPEHTMVCYTQAGRLERRTAESIFNKSGMKIVLTGTGLRGNTHDELFGLPAGDVMEFIGWYLAEGWHNTSNYDNGTVSKGTLFIGQSRKANPTNCRRLEHLFDRLGFGWNYMKSNSGYSLYARQIPMELRKHLYEQGSCHEKFIPEFVYDLHPDLLWRLMDGLVLGDGCLGQRASTYDNGVSFYSTSKRLADGFQTLAALVGYRATIQERPTTDGGSIRGRAIKGTRTGYNVKLCTRDRAKVDRCVHERIDYQGPAYCITVPNHAIYVRHNGIPSWTGNSNVVVPLAKAMTDSLVARTFTALFGHGHRVWATRTENESNKSLAENIARYINWQADGNDFSLKVPSYDWLLEGIGMGSSVLAGNWRDDVRYTFVRQGNGKDRRIIPQRVSMGRGPLLEHVPREQVLWDTTFRIHEAPVVIRELHLSWAKLAMRAALDPLKSWDRDAVERVKGAGGIEGHSQVVSREKREQDSQAVTTLADDDHDVREIHADWPVMLELGFSEKDLGIDTPFVPLVFTYHRKKRETLRVVAEPYFVPYKPFFDFFYRKRSGRGHSVGVVKDVEQLQSGMTTLFNQGIDAQTRANAVWAKTKMRRHLDQPLDPAKPIFDPDMQGFEPLKIPGADFGNIQLIQVAQAMSERLTGQADPAFGRETRLGGHPAPATSTLALMQNADQLSGPMRDLLGDTLSRVGEFVASLDQQFETDEDGKINKVLGEHDGELVKSFLFPTEPIPGNYQFNVRGLSRDLNPDQQFNRAVQVAQLNQNYWAFAAQATNAVVQLLQAGLPPEIQQFALNTWVTSIRAQTKVHKFALEAADIDEVERFVLAIDQGERNARNELRDFADRAGQAASLGAGAQGGAGPGTALPAGRGAAAPNGAAGGPRF